MGTSVSSSALPFSFVLLGQVDAEVDSSASNEAINVEASEGSPPCSLNSAIELLSGIVAVAHKMREEALEAHEHIRGNEELILEDEGLQHGPGKGPDDPEPSAGFNVNAV